MTRTRHTDQRSSNPAAGREQARHERHRRGDVLRDVATRLEAAHARSETASLLDVATATPGATQCFADDVDLVGALLLRWHARLSAALERALARQPHDRAAAVADAWARTAQAAPGVRALLDQQLLHPASERLEHLLARARRVERVRLAQAAGQAPLHVPRAAGRGGRAVAAGERLEARGRSRLQQLLASPAPPADVAPARRPGSPRLAARLRALVDA